MKFLHGKALTKEIQKICQTQTSMRLAVAYWGQDALKLTRLHPKRRNVKLICCLSGGASDPDVIKKFGARARQDDFLHAKVIWTQSQAIVSSANISSNGMPDEEHDAGGLIEAGLLVTESKQLAEVKAWFDRRYTIARAITATDLKKAKEARSAKLWGKPKIQRSFIDALKDGGAQEFKQLRISFALWTDHTTKAEDRAAQRHFKESTIELEETLKIERRDFKRLDWFSAWNDLPSDTFLISCRYKKESFTEIYSCKTFHTRKNWPILADGERTTVTFVLGPALDGFTYRLSARDKRIIKSAARDLWRKAKGSNGGRLLKLQDAVPILLRHSNKMDEA